MVTETKEDVICVVAICKECREAVIFKYIKNGIHIVTSGIPVIATSGGPMNWGKPNIEWCPCGSDEPRFLCKVSNEDIPGLEEKCEKCEFKFVCASSRIEVIYEGEK